MKAQIEFKKLLFQDICVAKILQKTEQIFSNFFDNIFIFSSPLEGNYSPLISNEPSLVSF